MTPALGVCSIAHVGTCPCCVADDTLTTPPRNICLILADRRRFDVSCSSPAQHTPHIPDKGCFLHSTDSCDSTRTCVGVDMSRLRHQSTLLQLCTCNWRPHHWSPTHDETAAKWAVHHFYVLENQTGMHSSASIDRPVRLRSNWLR